MNKNTNARTFSSMGCMPPKSYSESEFRTPIFTNCQQFHLDAREIHTFYLMKNLHTLYYSESLKCVVLSILLCWRLHICYDGALSSSAEVSGTDYLRKYKPKCFHKCSILFKVQHFNVLIQWYFRSNSPPK